MQDKLKIQIASDLHLEFEENRQWLSKNPLIKKGEVLLLAGDIVTETHKKEAEKFFKKWSGKYDLILSTMGNHEFFDRSVDFAYPHYRENISHNHFHLNNETYIYKNVKFVVSALWTDIIIEEAELIEKRMNDYRMIREGEENPVLITTETTKKLHDISIEFLRNAVKEDFDGRIVIMSHHLPSFQSIDREFLYSGINSAYATDLDKFIADNPKIKLWVHGHSHNFHEIKIGGCRVLRNPMGYVLFNQQKDFKRDCFVEI